MGETVEITKEQKLFYKGKRALANFDRISEERGLTQEELDTVNRLKELLLKSVMRFAIQEAHKMLGKYTRVPPDAYSEISQEIALIFFEKLPDYDPLKCTPTTYYLPYFKQCISKFIRDNIVHLTQYDSSNSKKIMHAIREYEAKGIPWTEDMIATRSGLSIKIVRSTLAHKKSANYAAIDSDDALQLRSSFKTPEESLLQTEGEQVLYEAIVSSLDEEERELLMLRLNLDGRKELSYETMSEQTGIPIREIKCRYNGIIRKLRNNDALNARFRYLSHKKGISQLHLQDRSGEIMEQQMLANI